MYKKVISLLVILAILASSLVTVGFASGESQTLQDGIVNVGCATLTDAVQIANSAELLIVEGAYKTLYKVNFLTGDLKSVKLDNAPTNVDYFGNQVYVGCSAQKMIMIYDLTSLALIDTITTSATFFDMAVGNDGYIYTIGSGCVYGYSPSEKRLISSIYCSYSGILERHPGYNSFYFTRKGVSPADVHVVTYDKGTLKSTYDSRYHGNYVEGYVNRITPDGKFLLNSEGNAARVSSVQSEDIVFSFALGNYFSDLCFDTIGDKFFSVSGTKITQYKTSTFEQLNSFVTQKNAERVFFYGGRLGALEKGTNGLYYIERLNPAAVSLPEALVPTTTTLSKTDNILNIDINTIVDSRSIEQTGDLLLLSPTYLYKINVSDNAQTKIRFPYTATKLAVYDNTVFVGAGGQGAVCIYDLQTMNYIKTIFTDELFLGMEVGDDGYLYTGENGSWEAARCGFDVNTGIRVERVEDTYGTADYVKAPTQNSFYYIDDWGDFARRTYAGGKITASKTFSSRSYGKIADVSQDGTYVFFASGEILKYNSSDATVSLQYKTSTSVIDACFAPSRNSVYAALSNKQIYAYDYATFEGTATYETQGYPQYIFVNGNILTAISKETSNGSTYFVETIDLDAPKATIQTTITTRSLSNENGCIALSAKSNAKTVFNNEMMYIADGSDNAVYAVDTTNMTETKITFPNAPNSLYYYNNELYVCFGSNGILAILDSKTYQVKDKLILGATIYDMVVGNDGFIYTIDTGYNYARSYSRTTGQQLSSNWLSEYGKLLVNPKINTVYLADLGVSPQDLYAFTYDNGLIKSSYNSPYHGDYSIGSRIKISPDGKQIFTNSGSVFISTDFKTEDMLYKNKFTSFNDLAFDLTGNRMFTAQDGGNLSVYDYTTYENKGFIKTAFPVVEMSLYNDKILAVSTQSSSSYNFELLSLSDITQVKPEKITVNTADAVFLTKTGYFNINPTIVYNDGTSKSITNTAVYKTSDDTVASINSSGRIQANARGYAKITVESDGISKSIDVFVDTDVDSLAVEGYDIAFSTSKTSYTVMLQSGTVSAPKINVSANNMFNVNITYPTSLPGTATVTVGAAGTVKKTYGIYFDKQKETVSQVTANPESGAVEAGTQIVLQTQTVGATIYYSLNGGYYSTYTGPITINDATTVRAYASNSGMNNSATSVFAYTIKPKLVTTVSVIGASSSGVIGGTVDITVAISDNSQMATGSFVLYYDTNQLTPISYTIGNVIEQSSPMVNLNYSDPITNTKQVKVSWMGVNPLSSDGDLLRVSFKVNDSVADGTIIPISISNLILVNMNAEPVAWNVIGGNITAVNVLYGDSNSDGIVNILDALKILRYDAGFITLTDKQKINADVNLDGKIDIFDAMAVQKFDLGL